jgi:hypothetical protein
MNNSDKPSAANAAHVHAKPCPFCGSREVVLRPSGTRAGLNVPAVMQCLSDDCGACVSFGAAGSDNPRAIACWDSRA